MKVRYNDKLNWKGQLFCVKDSEFDALMEELRLAVGGNWKDIARQARLSTRYVRRLRGREWKTVSWHVMDKVLSRLGMPGRMETIRWYTPEELVKMGVWKPHSMVGLEGHREKKQPRKDVE